MQALPLMNSPSLHLRRLSFPHGPLPATRSPFRFLAVFLLSGLLTTLQAANHYINAAATGTNDGSSWANAFPSFAAAEAAGMIRGDTYFVAGGTYNESPYINVALSGTTWLYIKKANTTDNSADPGFSSTFATTPVTINGTLDLDKGYVSVNGVTGSGTSGYGIVINNPAFTNVLTLENAPSFSVSHCQIQGAGFSSSTTAFSGIYYNCVAASQKNTYIGYCWITQVTTNGATLLNLNGTSYTDYGLTFENNVISETGGCLDPSQHGQGMQLGNTVPETYLIIRNNTFRNVVGSACISLLTSANNVAIQNIEIYNNIFYITDPTTYTVLSPGVIWWEGSHTGGETGNSLVNVLIANNTFYNIAGASNQAQIVLGYGSNETITNCVAENNVWENCNFTRPNFQLTLEAFNAYYNDSGSGLPSGTPKQITGSASTFVNAAAYNFQLLSNGYAVGRATNLPNSFTTDITGLTRGGVWDVGAYQYQTTADAAPANAKVSVTVGP